jgi:putative transposase
MQWQYKTFYLYGVVEPKREKVFSLSFAIWTRFASRNSWNCFLRLIQEDLHIIQVDNGSFHSSLQLHLPDNVILLFQPSHTPQVNPIERLWEAIKAN